MNACGECWSRYLPLTTCLRCGISYCPADWQRHQPCRECPLERVRQAPVRAIVDDHPDADPSLIRLSNGSYIERETGW